MQIGGGKLTGAADDHIDEIAAAPCDLDAAQPETMANAQPLGFDLQEFLEGVGLLLALGGGADVGQSLVGMNQHFFEINLHHCPFGASHPAYTSRRVSLMEQGSYQQNANHRPARLSATIQGFQSLMLCGLRSDDQGQNLRSCRFLAGGITKL